MQRSDTKRQLKIIKIKDWEQKGYSFLEIVALYNAEFGTEHFMDILASDTGYKATLISSYSDKQTKGGKE